MSDFIEEEFLNEQVESIKEISDHVTTLTRLGSGHGEWHLDQKLKG
jgi:ferritin heavy chain